MKKDGWEQETEREKAHGRESEEEALELMVENLGSITNCRSYGEREKATSPFSSLPKRGKGGKKERRIPLSRRR